MVTSAVFLAVIAVLVAFAQREASRADVAVTVS